MLKKRIALIGGLLVLSIVGQVLLGPCLGNEDAPFRQPENESETTQSAGQRHTPSPKSVESESANELKYADEPLMPLGPLWRQFIYMIGFVILIGLGAWVFLRKFSGGAVGTGQVIRIGETVRLGPRKSLHLVRIGSKTLLVANAADSLSLLADVSDGVSSHEDDNDG